MMFRLMIVVVLGVLCGLTCYGGEEEGWLYNVVVDDFTDEVVGLARITRVIKGREFTLFVNCRSGKIR